MVFLLTELRTLKLAECFPYAALDAYHCHLPSTVTGICSLLDCKPRQ